MVNSSFIDAEKCISDGMILPLIGYYASFHSVRIIGYLLLLLYLFLGIAIIADIFMCSIEKITSQTRKIILNPGDETTAPEYIEVTVWNETVANLTLMALGSSAPEILLAIIEIIRKNFNSGDLGPGTIVGSAAFNLLVITAVCVVSIPNNESRSIRGTAVFTVTTIFSVFAYLWLWVILELISPGYVDIWEAFLTFFFFPLLVAIAYAADKNFFNMFQAKKTMTETDLAASAGNLFPKGKVNKKTLAKFIKEVKKISPDITSEDAACLAAAYLFEHEKHSRLFYRVSACRWLTGSKSPIPHLTGELAAIYSTLTKNEGCYKGSKTDGVGHELKTVAVEHAHEHDIAVVQFQAPTAVVMENAGSVEITILRYGKMDNEFRCIVETLDRTAKSGRDYKGIKETLVFKQNETEKKLSIEIIDDDNWNPDNIFLIKLTLPDEEMENKAVAKGRICMMSVTIVDDDFPGIIAFGQRLITVEENAGKVIIPVLREQGADGIVEVKWKTVDGTSKNGRDFTGGEGTLVFEHGVIRKEIEIPIVDDMEEAKDEYFEVHLLSATNNAKISKNNIVMVTVTNDQDFNLVMSRIEKQVKKNRYSFKIHKDLWIEQFKAAMAVDGGSGSGGGEDGEEKALTFIDYCLHVLCFGWKIIFAAVPPATLYGGWLTFIVSLALIGVITTIVGDTAESFGCLAGIDPAITAITLVALGTSLPDTFASRVAAKMEKTADNAIGNVTGSNSVNVFLGLGLPWLMASIYHASNGQRFEVKSGSLGYSVALFTGLSIICIAVIIVRRLALGGELGGPRKYSVPTFIFFIFLWFVYIVGSIIDINKVDKK